MAAVKKKRAVQNRRVLVLNKGFQALGIVTLERSLKLLTSKYRDDTVKARILDDDGSMWKWDEWSEFEPEAGEDGIQGVSRRYRFPKIIVLMRYGKIPKRGVHFSRHLVYDRDGHQCMYCGCKPGRGQLSLDHVLPRSRGGQKSWLNCVAACKPCNLKKAAKTPEEAGMKLLRQPFVPKFGVVKTAGHDHPSWSTFLGQAESA